jgi:hypothetical protein
VSNKYRHPYIQGCIKQVQTYLDIGLYQTSTDVPRYKALSNKYRRTYI